MYEQITPEEAKKIMDSGEEHIILDTREQDEFDEGHIPGAILIPYTEIENKAEEASDPLEMVRLAPSAVNKQPWRVVATDNAVHFYLKRSKGFEGLKTFKAFFLFSQISYCHFLMHFLGFR